MKETLDTEKKYGDTLEDGVEHTHIYEYEESADLADSEVYENDADLTGAEMYGDRRPNGRGLNRILYVIALVAAVFSGTCAGVLGGMTAGLAHVTDISMYSDKEVEELTKDGWYRWIGTFTGGEHAQADMVSRNLMIVVALAVIFLAGLVILCVQTGRQTSYAEGSGAADEQAGPGSDIRLNWFDRIWSEVHIAAMCGAAVGAVFLAVPIFEMTQVSGWVNGYKPYQADLYYYGVDNNTILTLCILGMAALIAAAVICCVTLVKKIKAKSLIRNSLLGLVMRWLGIGARYAGHGAVRAGKGIGSAFRRSSRKLTIPADEDKGAAIKILLKYILIAIGLIFIPDIFGAGTWDYGVFVFCQLVAAVLAVILIIRKVGKLTEIRAGVVEVKSGNLSHKITVNTDAEGPKTDLDKLASDINHISEATNKAVMNEIKNQRLKTDLISNVSHDLKTPLTSMISYLDILSKEGLDSPDAAAHLAIVQEKTERLRTLTEELFEAAKASSGNISCDIEDIDIRSLIDQSLAEMDDRLSGRDLTIKRKYRTNNTMVRADGKLLYRIFENVLGNVSKYALEGSRVYIDVSEAAGNSMAAGSNMIPGSDMLLVEIKNISRDELNISAEELMERFTRGDQSRNTEGSGLGLAIAKDLARIMGGSFDISIDGDMFKSSILLPIR